MRSNGLANCQSVKKLIEAFLVVLRPVEYIDDSTINDTLFKSIPSVSSSLREKVTSHIQATSAFGYLG